ncbi:winged helix-turn-helix domain-containing protein [Halorussus sp. MSC15.2]|uniref:winged helix-turn-helix domain-containing protein n=1 Tax=Halorussus sp. MSC15.2 TaxID=2283638 RepID=UPI0013D33AF3|nr:winged helix-turn-helix domain-containing protein [Halorussus sp. MSC15.2]NEU59194.1 winged helix-turn-helix transcriptional regulator [Halorussus sp. MSC15.2]
MTNADDYILEFLLNEGNKEIVATPSVIAENIDFNSGYVRQRISKLLDAGLIEYHSEPQGMYQITQKGRDYLAGDLDAEELEKDKE